MAVILEPNGVILFTFLSLILGPGQVYLVWSEYGRLVCSFGPGFRVQGLWGQSVSSPGSGPIFRVFLPLALNLESGCLGVVLGLWTH